MIVGAEIETVAWFESESSQGKDAINPSDAGIIKEIHEMARAALGRTSRFDRGIVVKARALALQEPERERSAAAVERWLLAEVDRERAARAAAGDTRQTHILRC